MKTKKLWIYRAAMIIYDVVAVNFAFWFALVARFFIGNEWKAGAAQYVDTLLRIMPIYTVACIAIFFIFRLYNTLWKVAGIRDLNNIVIANLVTAAVFAAGSLLANQRMPLTIYFIGPAFQLMLIGASRMGIKLLLMERDQIRKKNTATINVMIVGLKHIGRTVRRQIDHSATMQTKCIVDTQSAEKGLLYDGIPVIGGVEGIAEALTKYSINSVLIADTFLTEAERQDIRKLCEDKKIEIADMTGYVENGTDALSLASLLQAIPGPVTLCINGKERSFTSGETAMLSVNKRYMVKQVSSKASGVCIELSDNPLLSNSSKEEWIAAYKEETGNDVSFF